MQCGVSKDWGKIISLCRFISTRTDNQIKVGSLKDRCQDFSYISSRRKINIHVRQYCTKLHSVLQIYDTVYQHQQHGGCKQNAKNIYEVDTDSYSDFLRHIRWMSTQPFGERTPIPNKNGQYSTTQQPLRKNRRLQKE